MSFTRGLRKILERGPIMKDRVVVHKLYIAGFQRHHQVQIRIVGQLTQQIERFCLNRGQRCNAGKAAGRLDILSLIDRRHQPLVPVENRDREIRLASRRNFTTAPYLW